MISQLIKGIMSGAGFTLGRQIVQDVSKKVKENLKKQEEKKKKKEKQEEDEDEEES